MAPSHRIRGVTLAEILVVLSIVVLVAALSFPMIDQVRRSARVSECTSNLRQLHVALTIYRSDCQGVDVGSPPEMGLPGLDGLRAIGRGLKCGGVNPRSCEHPGGYEINWTPFPFAYPENDAHWMEYVSKRGESAVLVADFGHSAFCPSTPLSVNKGLGLTLGGAVLVKQKRADTRISQFFAED